MSDRKEERRVTRILVLCAGIWLAALPGDTPRSAEGGEYSLGTGDRLQITVFGHEDLSGEFAISETGTVSLPLAGNLKLDGLTVHQAEQAVVGAFKPDYLLNPKIGIEVLNYRPFYILGEVNEPGAYPYVTGMTVTEAVAIGGGFTYRAKKEEMVVIRATDTTRTERPIAATDVVHPGDVVKVLERFF